MKKPAVSIVIPTFNRPDLLREALDSVAAQTFRDYEVIVVDDGSTPPIADAVANHSTKPKIIRQVRQGPAAARNRGIADARADLVAFLDSDDLWLPTKLERYMDAMGRLPDVSIFYGPMLPMDSKGQAVHGRTKPRHQGRIIDQLFKSCFVDIPTVVCRKDLLTRAGGFNASLPVCEDYDLWLRLSLTESFGFIDEPLAKRRLHDDRLSKSAMARNFAIRADTLLRFFEKNKNVLNREAAAKRLSRVFFVAARAAFREGDYTQAVERCKTARAFGGSLRTILLQMAASAYSICAGPNREPAPSSLPPSRPDSAASQ